jgi:hypothetical protein
LRQTQVLNIPRPKSNPFQYYQHRDKKPSYAKAVVAAATQRGVISYKESAAILQKDGLEIDKKQYYNLHQKEDKGILTRQDELQLILRTLEEECFHPRRRKEYTVNKQEEQTERVIKDLF